MGLHPESTAEKEYGFLPDSAARQARRSVDDLRGRVPTETLERLRLLVSELATNAVRHSGIGSEPTPDGRVGLRFVLSSGRVRMEVTDPGPGFEAPGHPTPDAAEGSGYGLYLVDKLADRWGVMRGELTRVWLELTYEP